MRGNLVGLEIAIKIMYSSLLRLFFRANVPARNRIVQLLQIADGLEQESPCSSLAVKCCVMLWLHCLKVHLHVHMAGRERHGLSHYYVKRVTNKASFMPLRSAGGRGEERDESVCKIVCTNWFRLQSINFISVQLHTLP